MEDKPPVASRREVARLRIALAALAAGWLGSVAWLALRRPSLPPVLAVERLEILEPDGRPAFIFANSQRPAPATIDGQVIMEGQEEERRGVPSIIFFDGKGDEVGGMLMGVRETTDGYSAVRHLSLDGYKQDQTIVLSHNQSPGGSLAALRISDRPLEVSLLDAIGSLGLEPGATREELQAAIGALPEEGREARLRELFGVPRVFLGSTRRREASLILNDGAGRPRIVIEVTEEGEPSIRILDEEGETVESIPE